MKKEPTLRPSFDKILSEFNSLSMSKYDLELIAKLNLMTDLKEGIKSGNIKEELMNSLGRNLIHECCFYGNLSMLQYLVSIWGEQCLNRKDKFGVTLTHLAARNGHLNILQFLASKNEVEKENRLFISPLDLCITMKHFECFNFLIPFSSQEILNQALFHASSEGQFMCVQKLVEHKVDIDYEYERGVTSLFSN
jgi:ankyrin repeat protein